MSLIRQVTTVGEQSSQGTMGVRASFSCRSNPVKIQFHHQHQSTPLIPSFCLVSCPEAAYVNSWHLYRLVTKKGGIWQVWEMWLPGSCSFSRPLFWYLGSRPLSSCTSPEGGDTSPVHHTSQPLFWIPCALPALAFLYSHTRHPQGRPCTPLIKDGPAEPLGISTPSPMNFKCLGRLPKCHNK